MSRARSAPRKEPPRRRAIWPWLLALLLIAGGIVGGVLVTDDQELDAAFAFLQNGSGGVPGPFDAYLTMRGAKTLAVRMDKNCDNAEAVVDLLQGHAAIESVLYPGRPGHPGQHRRVHQDHQRGGVDHRGCAAGEGDHHLEPGGSADDHARHHLLRHS